MVKLLGQGYLKPQITLVKQQSVYPVINDILHQLFHVKILSKLLWILFLTKLAMTQINNLQLVQVSI